jgi:hypothetical protein
VDFPYIDGDEIVDGASITDFIGGLSVKTRHRFTRRVDLTGGMERSGKRLRVMG